MRHRPQPLRRNFKIRRGQLGRQALKLRGANQLPDREGQADRALGVATDSAPRLRHCQNLKRCLQQLDQRMQLLRQGHAQAVGAAEARSPGAAAACCPEAAAAPAAAAVVARCCDRHSLQRAAPYLGLAAAAAAAEAAVAAALGSSTPRQPSPQREQAGAPWRAAPGAPSPASPAALAPARQAAPSPQRRRRGRPPRWRWLPNILMRTKQPAPFARRPGPACPTWTREGPPRPRPSPNQSGTRGRTRPLPARQRRASLRVPPRTRHLRGPARDPAPGPGWRSGARPSRPGPRQRGGRGSPGQPRRICRPPWWGGRWWWLAGGSLRARIRGWSRRIGGSTGSARRCWAAFSGCCVG